MSSIDIPTRLNLTIALPVYNEPETIAELVRDSLAVLERATTGFREVLIVDDGSAAPAAELARELAARPGVRLVTHPRNRGFAAVQRTCYREARGDWVFLLPADGQIAPAVLFDLLPGCAANSLILGVAAGAAVDRRFFSRLYHRLVRRLFSLPYGDFGACLLVKRELATSVRSTAATPVAMTELVVEAHRRGAGVAEVAVRKTPRRFGRSKAARLWRTAPRTAWELAAVYWHTRTKRKPG